MEITLKKPNFGRFSDKLTMKKPNIRDGGGSEFTTKKPNIRSRRTDSGVMSFVSTWETFQNFTTSHGISHFRHAKGFVSAEFEFVFLIQSNKLIIFIFSIQMKNKIIYFFAGYFKKSLWLFSTLGCLAALCYNIYLISWSSLIWQKRSIYCSTIK